MAGQEREDRRPRETEGRQAVPKPPSDELLEAQLKGSILDVLGKSEEPLAPEELSTKVMDSVVESGLLEILSGVDLTKRPLSKRINLEIIDLLESQEISHTKERELVRNEDK